MEQKFDPDYGIILLNIEDPTRNAVISFDALLQAENEAWKKRYQDIHFASIGALMDAKTMREARIEGFRAIGKLFAQAINEAMGTTPVENSKEQNNFANTQDAVNKMVAKFFNEAK